jgi:phage-related protein
MAGIAFYNLVWEELEASPSGLRGSCKAALRRLAEAQPGAPTGLRLEKLQSAITELKVSWNRQEFRLLFFREQSVVYVVNFFQKKTRKCPPSEIARAVGRMTEIQVDQAKVLTRSLH